MYFWTDSQSHHKELKWVRTAEPKSSTPLPISPQGIEIEQLHGVDVAVIFSQSHHKELKLDKP